MQDWCVAGVEDGSGRQMSSPASVGAARASRLTNCITKYGKRLSQQSG